jgi:hypothetical protein
MWTVELVSENWRGRPFPMLVLVVKNHPCAQRGVPEIFGVRMPVLSVHMEKPPPYPLESRWTYRELRFKEPTHPWVW